MSHLDPPENPANRQRIIYRPWITKPDGTKVYAWQYGIKAFPIPVND